MPRPICYVCEKPAVNPYGFSEDILLIGEFPGAVEMVTGKPFTGESGKILRKELSILGLDLLQCRVTNVWFHVPNKNKDCFEAGKNACLEEAKNKKAILLLGSDTVELFTDYKVSEVSGLQIESTMLSAPIIYACCNPAVAFHGVVGELKFGLTNFVDRLKEEEIL